MADQVEVDISHGDKKAIIEGKTAVTFKRFVGLILQRKVTALFKDWGDKPIIIDSELLTSLASAPQDSQDTKGQLVLVTLGIGMLSGVFFFAVLQVALMLSSNPMEMKDLFVIIGVLAGLALMVTLLMNMKKPNKGEKVVESIERVANFLTK